jgi:predicted ester cyclase
MSHVVILHTHYATHTREFMGIPTTGISVVVNGLEQYRIVNGKIVEFWRHDDDAGLLRQLGAIPQSA